MLNMQQYKIKAKYRPTGAYRTRSFYGHNEEEALRQMGPDFELPPKSIEIVPQEPPTERQIPYAQSLGITVTPDMGKLDVSMAISRVTDRDDEPAQGLRDFADANNILFSSFSGNRALHSIIFQSLSGTDRTAFFVFCVYRFLSGDTESNFQLSPHREKIYAIASDLTADERFIKSLTENYIGADLSVFGQYSPDGGLNVYFGGSNRTTAYKEARSRLLSAGLVPERRASASIPMHETYTEIYNEIYNGATQPPSKKSGCLAALFFLFLFISFAAFLINLF